MDFLIIKKRNQKDAVEVYPDFRVRRSADLMIRGGVFYAVWDGEVGLWSTDEYRVQQLVDAELREYAEKLEAKTALPIHVKYMADFSSYSWTNWRLFLSKLSDNSTQLDNAITFSNTKITKKDHASRRLTYPLDDSDTPAFDSLFGTLYDEENLTKILWAIGSIVDGGSKKIQKFFVLFGDPGTGKSTALNVIQQMFPDYYTSFEARTLISGSSGFATESFRDNPLIAINHDGDLSRVKDNSILNSIVAHDIIPMNVKYQRSYSIRLNTMLFIATNKPVSITDAKSGLIRRLVDIRPTGATVSAREYDTATSQIEFELGGIAAKALAVYKGLGKNHYNHYKPMDMILRTDVFFNFVDEHQYDFIQEGQMTLTRAWALYKIYAKESGIEYTLPRYKFRDELKNYWVQFHDSKRIGGRQYRSVFEEFDIRKMGDTVDVAVDEDPSWIALEKQPSVLDINLADQPAQYTNQKGNPKAYWDDIKSTLSDIKTTRLHFVIPAKQHIVVDFDITDDAGNKSLSLNIEAAEKFPPTYVEVSKSGNGLHLHYKYDGDTSVLSHVYGPHIDIRLPKGHASIRRKLTMCNELPIATISSGLPLKQIKGDKMVNMNAVRSERSLRTLLKRNIYKEIHAATKPSVDFIYKILTDANNIGLVYDVSDLKGHIMHMASNSTNNAAYCMELVLQMPFKSDLEEIYNIKDQPIDPTFGMNTIDDDGVKQIYATDPRLTFFDVEVFPNLVLVNWKYEGVDSPIHQMFNPSSTDIESLLQHRLVGFNNRRYDNHILYAIYLGFNNTQIYNLSSRIVNNDREALFREAYRVSYTDIFDYAAKKQSLKKWQIELGIFHKELDLPWDKPVAEELWPLVAEYCDNDVISTEVVHEHLHADFQARCILAKISGLTVNDSTLAHTTKVVFGSERHPQDQFEYVDLRKTFPGYEFSPMGTTYSILETFDAGEPEEREGLVEYTSKKPTSKYRGEIVGEGGYVFAIPGIYENVVYLDVASMHPTSIEIMNLFGPFTRKYTDLKAVRMAIKKGDFVSARSMYGGLLREYLNDKDEANALAYALKIIINIVYGLTAAKFPNSFNDPRNMDNVVAKRGALFMVDLKHALQERGINAVHFKTDSVKIANHTQADIDFVVDFGKQYGYDFGIEGVFKKMALINDAVLIGEWDTDGPEKWYAVGARFKHPYVYKQMFTHEPTTPVDLIEAKAVRAGHMSLNMNEGKESDHLVFVGKVGTFFPIKKGRGGGELLRITDGKQFAVTGTKGYRWLPSDMVLDENRTDDIDDYYYTDLIDEALKKINKVGDAVQFVYFDSATHKARRPE